MGRFACIMWLAGTLALTAETAVAQDMNSKFDVFAGYSFLSSEYFEGPVLSDGFGEGIGRGANHGFIASFTFNLTSALGIEAEYSNHRRESTPFDIQQVNPSTPTLSVTQTDTLTVEQKHWSLLFGPKISHRSGGIRVFAHFLVGLANLEETADGSSTTVYPQNVFGLNAPNLATTETFTGTSTIDGTGFAFALGGGVDWTKGRWGIRVIQADYIKVQTGGDVTASFPQADCTPTNSNFCGAPSTLPADTVTGTGSDVLNNIRLSTGVVLRFGGD